MENLTIYGIVLVILIIASIAWLLLKKEKKEKGIMSNWFVNKKHIKK